MKGTKNAKRKIDDDNSSDSESSEEPVQQRSNQGDSSKTTPKVGKDTQTQRIEKIEETSKTPKKPKKQVVESVAHQIAQNLVEMIVTDNEEDEEIRKKKKADRKAETKRKERIMTTEPIPKPKNFKIPKNIGEFDQMSREEKAFFMQRFSVMQPSRPFVCFFHIFFKLTAGISYLFLNLFFTSTLMCFLVTFGSVLLDFWITKNISGRLLVGLRWWNGQEFGEDVEQDEDLWVFESFDCQFNFHTFDLNIFWWGMFFSTCFWLFMSLGKILSINFLWGLLTGVAVLLNGTNLYAYYRCYRFHQQKMSSLGSEFAERGAMGERLLGTIF